mmetsp:Transcript_2815/g.9685  ORF Transcript_2815/g.9685 Transcript_2815/m.9685 type:complete len:322 (+) Transcript_2815:1398-2363(+)
MRPSISSRPSAPIAVASAPPPLSDRTALSSLQMDSRSDSTLRRTHSTTSFASAPARTAATSWENLACPSAAASAEPGSGEGSRGGSRGPGSPSASPRHLAAPLSLPTKPSKKCFLLDCSRCLTWIMDNMYFCSFTSMSESLTLSPLPPPPELEGPAASALLPAFMKVSRMPGCPPDLALPSEASAAAGWPSSSLVIWIPSPRISRGSASSRSSRATASLAMRPASSAAEARVTLLLRLSHHPWPKNFGGGGAFGFLSLSFSVMHLPLIPALLSLRSTSSASFPSVLTASSLCSNRIPQLISAPTECLLVSDLTSLESMPRE